MSKSIWKFPIAITDYQQVAMPEFAEIIAAQFQGADLCLWAIVSTDAERTEKRRICIYGTGNPFPEELGSGYRYSHIATVQRGGFVWHVFEETAF